MVIVGCVRWLLETVGARRFYVLLAEVDQVINGLFLLLTSMRYGMSRQRDITGLRYSRPHLVRLLQ